MYMAPCQKPKYAFGKAWKKKNTFYGAPEGTWLGLQLHRL